MRKINKPQNIEKKKIEQKKIKNLLKEKTFLEKLKTNNEFIKIKTEMLKKKTQTKIKEINNLVNKYQEAYLEIRAGIGGTESNIFVNELFGIYKKFFINKQFIHDVLYIKKTTNGAKRIIIRIKGYESFSILKNENGIHRIQRVPKTEKKGRVHTSTCVIKTYEKEPEEKINLYKKDIKIDTFKSSGSGGQNVNKTNSAVRITHIKTGIKVECQKERSQLANKKIAMNILYSKIVESEQNIKNNETQKKRKTTANKSERSFKIRTYNFINRTITNHKNNKKTKLSQIIKYGRIDKIK